MADNWQVTRNTDDRKRKMDNYQNNIKLSIISYLQVNGHFLNSQLLKSYFSL